MAIPEANILVQYANREVKLTVQIFFANFFFLFESQKLQSTDILGSIHLPPNAPLRI